MPYNLQYTLTAQEFTRIFRHVQKSLQRRSGSYWLTQLIGVVLGGAMTFALLTAYNLPGKLGMQFAPMLVGAMLLAVACLFLLAWVYNRSILRMAVEKSHHVIFPQTFMADERGIKIVSQHNSSEFAWTAVQFIDEFEGAICVFVDEVSFYPISASAFASPVERDAFVAFARSHICSTANVATPAAMVASAGAETGSQISADTVLSAAPLPPVLTSPLRVAWPLLRTNIVNAFRLAVFMRVSESSMPVMWWQVLAFTLLGAAVPLLGSLLEVGLDGVFQNQALPGMLFHVPLLACAAITVAYAARRPEKSLALIQMLLMIAFAVDILCVAITQLPLSGIAGRSLARATARMAPQASLVLPALWLALASVVAMARLLAIPPRARLLPILIAASLIALPLAAIYRDRAMWSESYDDRKAEAESYLRNHLTQEDIFYRQPELLARELAALQPQRPGVTEVFFIGMAGHGYQDVFKKEVDAVTELMRERFDAKGHTIRLINNRQTVATTPIASMTSLTASLKRTAAVMDIEEDILVLFLTSHGSETHRFSLDLYPMQFKELDPVALRKALDDSGIKHRVVLISACYSGGFIDALKDENTLVITAAAPDRNSFGCSNENDWTYFGKAYFDEALRKTTSFTEAFAIAKPVIEAREKQDDYTPSDPRIAEGAGIKTKLAALKAQLAGAASIATPAPLPGAITDAASRYAALVYDQQFFDVERAICLASTKGTGPDAMVARKADTFGGLTPAHAAWPQLTVAWDRFSEEMCKRFSEPEHRRDSFARHLRASSQPAEIESMIKFYATPRGDKWHTAEKRATQLMLDEVAKRQDALQMQLYTAYVETQDRVYKAYSKAEASKKR